MTSDEIRTKEPLALSERHWLKEIALQLALIAEKKGPKAYK